MNQHQLFHPGVLGHTGRASGAALAGLLPICVHHRLATRPVGSNLEITFALPKPDRTGRAPKSRLEKEQIRKRRNAEAAARYHIRKKSGLCMKCPNNAIKGQARCPACAENHRRARHAQRK